MPSPPSFSRFQIAVDDSLFVRRRQPLRDLHSIFNRLTLGQGAAIERCAQAFTLQELGYQLRRSLVLTDVVNGENIGVVERGHRPRLLLKATQAIGFAGEGFRRNFQSNIAPEARGEESMACRRTG